jgi:hypothetical protein
MNDPGAGVSRSRPYNHATSSISSGYCRRHESQLTQENSTSEPHLVVPPLSTHHLHRRIVRGLPRRLKHATPSDNLITLLRNDQFQDSVFLAIPDITVVEWPQVRLPRHALPEIFHSD